MKRTIAIMLLLLALLTACGTAPAAPIEAPPLPADDSPRILTPLTPGLHDPYVLLEDGYAAFGEFSLEGPMICISGEGLEIDMLQYQEVVDLLGYDLASELSTQPKRLQITEADLVTEIDRIIGVTGRTVDAEYLGTAYGGMVFEKKGDPAAFHNDEIMRYQKLTLSINREGLWIEHPSCEYFDVLPWNKTNHYRNASFQPPDTRSVISGVEVGFLHWTSATAVWPDYPSDEYYAGFTIEGVSYVLYSEYGYCTQEEFLTLTMAIIDAAVANAENSAAVESAVIDPFTTGLHDPYIEQPNGYAVFNEGDPETAMAALSADGDYQTLTRQLGFDPADVIVTLPSRLLAPHREGASMRWDGPDYELRKQDPDNRYKSIIAETQPRYLELRLSTDPVPALTDVSPGMVSYIGGTEVTLLHADPYAARWPGQPLARRSYYPSQYDPEQQHRYFAAFARNGVTVALYCQNGYLSQSDFLDMVTALVCAGR